MNIHKNSSQSDEMVGSSDLDGSDVDFKFEKLPVLTADVRQRALQTINSVIEVRLNKFLVNNFVDLGACSLKLWCILFLIFP